MGIDIDLKIELDMHLQLHPKVNLHLYLDQYLHIHKHMEGCNLTTQNNPFLFIMFPIYTNVN